MPFQAINENTVPIKVSVHGKTQSLISPIEKDDAGIMIRHWGPETDIEVHSHPYNEMFYVLEGEMMVGGEVYTTGACVYFSKNTPYGPTRAPKGAKVLRYAEAKPNPSDPDYNRPA